MYQIIKTTAKVKGNEYFLIQPGCTFIIKDRRKYRNRIHIDDNPQIIIDNINNQKDGQALLNNYSGRVDFINAVKNDYYNIEEYILYDADNDSIINVAGTGVYGLTKQATEKVRKILDEFDYYNELKDVIMNIRYGFIRIKETDEYTEIHYEDLQHQKTIKLRKLKVFKE